MKTNQLIPGLHRLTIAGLCLMLFAFTACDSSNALMENETAAVTPGISTLADNLQLTSNQTEQVNEVLAKRGEDEPGTLWYVAAELQQTLSTDQKTALFEKIEDARESRQEKRSGLRSNNNGEQRQRGLRGKRFGRGGGDAFGNIEGLTDEQKASMKALRETQREELTALRTQRKEGELDEEGFKAALEAMREAAEAELATILTAEQLEAMQAARAERQEKMKSRRDEGETRKGRFGEQREASEAARIEALGLTDAQREQIETLRAEQKEAGAALMNSIKESGDRETAREKVKAFHQETAEAVNEILTAEQQEIVKIHRALAFSVAKERTGEAAGRRANRRFNTFR
ncbi:MAG: hypothetical protein AAF564_06740 [Bacteroidota bacterium]